MKKQDITDESYERDLKRIERVTSETAFLVHLNFMEAPTPKIYLASWITLNAVIANYFADSIEGTSTKEALEMLVEGLKNELNHEENGEK